MPRSALDVRIDMGIKNGPREPLVMETRGHTTVVSFGDLDKLFAELFPGSRVTIGVRDKHNDA